MRAQHALLNLESLFPRHCVGVAPPHRRNLGASRIDDTGETGILPFAKFILIGSRRERATDSQFSRKVAATSIELRT